MSGRRGRPRVVIPKARQESNSATNILESEYEKLVQQNIKEKMEMLQKLGIEEAKEELMPKKRKCNTPKIKKYPDNVKVVEIPLVRRKSLRIRNVSAEEIHNKEPLATTIDAYAEKTRRKGPIKFADCSETQLEKLDELVNKIKSASVKLEIDSSDQFDEENFPETLKKLTLTKDSVAKVVPKRVCCIAIHPTTSRILAACSDKNGYIGLWDVNSVDDNSAVTLFDVHSKAVYCMKYAPGQPDKLYTGSYDGSLRCTDLNEATFNEVYSTDDSGGWIPSFDFLSNNTLCIGKGQGDVTIYDTRSKRKAQTHHLHHASLKTIQVHPKLEHYLVSASNDGYVAIWDTRNFKTPTCELQHSRCVQSAYFSPDTGKRILTLSSDDYIRMYESTSGVEFNSPPKEIKHDNHTGRWLTPFRATWVSRTDEYFVVGCMKHPRRIEVFNSAGRVVHEYFSDYLTSVCSINQFHPTLPVLVGGNSSGRLHIIK